MNSKIHRLQIVEVRLLELKCELETIERFSARTDFTFNHKLTSDKINTLIEERNDICASLENELLIGQKIVW